MSARAPKTYVYIDGFNLYNGLRRRAKRKQLDAPEYRWLNLVAFARALLPGCDVAQVRYFTARVKRKVGDPNIGLRQDVFLRALGTLPELSIHFGYFQKNKVWRPLVENPDDVVNVIDFKEKGSDVSLATHLLVDAYEGACQLAAIISNDSDLVEPIQVARTKLAQGVTVLNPQPGDTARKLRDVATAYHRIPERAFQESLFPDTLEDAQGRTIRKPELW